MLRPEGEADAAKEALMSKPKGTPENRELAFVVYARFGGRNVPAMLERLVKEHGLRISMNTLYRWKREGDWEARLENKEPTFEERTLLKLMGLMERVERRLAESPAVEPQAVYAYTNMVNTFFNLAKKLGPAMRTSPEEMRRRALEILENDYGIKGDGTRDWAA